VIAAYKEFEERVGNLAATRGAKGGAVRLAVARLPDQFSMRELRKACPGVSPEMVRVVLRELQKEGLIAPSGKGPGTVWKKRGNVSK